MTELTDLSDTDALNTEVTSQSTEGNVANMGNMDNLQQAILGMLSRFRNSNVFRLRDNTNKTKLLAFNLSGLTTSTTRTVTIPDANGTMALLSVANTFTADQTISSGAVGGKSYQTITNNNSNQFLKMGINADVAEFGWDNADTAQWGQWDDTSDTSLTVAFSVDVDRHFLVAKTVADGASAGHEFLADGFARHIRSAGVVADFNRLADDGAIINLKQAGTVEGVISVSGTTVTYGSFCGAHWSQLADGSKPPILRGTVVESIDHMSVWPGEENDQLAGFKISDTPASPAVYGVFMTWDVENDAATIASLGAFLIRVNAGVSVKRGDLLESAGNGCARVQADDLFRAATIAKVTSNHVVETYGDGSYLVPCTLHCG